MPKAPYPAQHINVVADNGVNINASCTKVMLHDSYVGMLSALAPGSEVNVGQLAWPNTAWDSCCAAGLYGDANPRVVRASKVTTTPGGTWSAFTSPPQSRVAGLLASAAETAGGNRTSALGFNDARAVVIAVPVLLRCTAAAISGLRCRTHAVSGVHGWLWTPPQHVDSYVGGVATAMARRNNSTAEHLR